MKFRQFVVMLVAVLALAACSGDAQDTVADDAGGNSGDAAEEPADEPGEDEPDTSGAGSTTIEINDPETDTFPGPEGEGESLGPVLADSEGMTLYVFANDSENRSTCYDDCATNWPAFTGEATAGEGVDESLIGTTQRDDGETQVTYAGQPLYYYAGDGAPGDVSGHMVGEVWWVVSPDGEAIDELPPGHSWIAI
jgi:predicted lipoprotein with Yx(FWY)xxD motif